MELLHADDQLAYVLGKEGKPWESAHVKTDEENSFDLAIDEHGLDGGQAALEGGRMVMDSGDIQERLQRASAKWKKTDRVIRIS